MKKNVADMTFAELLAASLSEVAAIERGEARPALERRGPLTARRASAEAAPAWAPNDIAELRKRLELSQSVFASALNVSPETVRAWEQGKRVPDGAAARLMQIVAEHPGVILGKIRAGGASKPDAARTPAKLQAKRGVFERPAQPSRSGQPIARAAKKRK